ncbi:MAG: hypothetical protein V1800_06790 [Candidatus Latescibacterota bacterium]
MRISVFNDSVWGSMAPGGISEWLLDVGARAQEGLIDLLTGDQWSSRERTPDQLVEQVRISAAQVAGTNVPVGLATPLFDQDQSAIMAKIEKGLPALRNAGLAELALYQDNMLENMTFATDRNAWKELANIIAPYRT